MWEMSIVPRCANQMLAFPTAEQEWPTKLFHDSSLTWPLCRSGPTVLWNLILGVSHLFGGQKPLSVCALESNSAHADSLLCNVVIWKKRKSQTSVLRKLSGGKLCTKKYKPAKLWGKSWIPTDSSDPQVCNVIDDQEERFGFGAKRRACRIIDGNLSVGARDAHSSAGVLGQHLKDQLGVAKGAFHLHSHRLCA